MISNQVCPSGKHLKALKLLLIIHCEQQSVQLFSPMFFFYWTIRVLSLSLSFQQQTQSFFIGIFQLDCSLRKKEFVALY